MTTTVATTRYAGSQAHRKRAVKTLAGGVATAMRAGQRPVPLTIDRGRGAYLIDVDGNSYIDYVLGFGPLLLGHAPEAVISAVTSQLRRGFTFGAQHELEAVLAEQIVEAVPCAELVCFSTTGSEAVHAALRLARAATGRSKVVKFEGHYHGWIDPLFVSTPGLAPAEGELTPEPTTPGQSAPVDVLVARWNDPDALAAVLAEHGPEVAAVIMEPVACNGGVIAPAPGYLERALGLTHAAGAVLIFDEVVTGFRLGLGGAQERYGVTPDLATFGKAVGAGMPLSVTAGRREIMELVADGRVSHVGTFNCAAPSAAAAATAIGIYRDQSPGFYDHLEGISALLASGLQEAAVDAGVPLKLHQVGSLLQTFFTDPDRRIESYADTAAADAERSARFSELMLDRGVMVLPRGWWFLSSKHSETEVEATVEAARGALAQIANDER
jgi:glutamate-1-semialdehyde 2,1-aminomutase